MKIWMLSIIYVVDIWVYCELVFVFYNKHRNGEYVLRNDGQYFQILNKFLQEASLLQPIMIQKIVFRIQNIFLLCGEMPQKGKP